MEAMTMQVFAPDPPNDPSVEAFKSAVNLADLRLVWAHPSLAKTEPWHDFILELEARGVEVYLSFGVASWSVQYQARDRQAPTKRKVLAAQEPADGVVGVEERVTQGEEVLGANAEAGPDELQALVDRMGPRPAIVCLCGSTRFIEAFLDEDWRLTLEGKIVLSVTILREGPARNAGELPSETIKQGLDILHLHKIDLADEILVLNVAGYIGESTAREIAYAERTGKPIRYLEAIS
jgi:hypothetical protein